MQPAPPTLESVPTLPTGEISSSTRQMLVDSPDSPAPCSPEQMPSDLSDALKTAKKVSETISDGLEPSAFQEFAEEVMRDNIYNIQLASDGIDPIPSNSNSQISRSKVGKRIILQQMKPDGRLAYYTYEPIGDSTDEQFCRASKAEYKVTKDSVIISFQIGNDSPYSIEVVDGKLITNVSPETLSVATAFSVDLQVLTTGEASKTNMLAAYLPVKI